MPASLRKMLQLKAAAEGKPRPDFRPALTLPSKPDSQKNQTLTEKAEQAEKEFENSVQLAAEEKRVESAKEKQKRKQEQQQVAKAPPGPVKPTLKTRKKDFLKKKKLKKKGKLVGSDSDEESDPETRLEKVAAATKPAFGAQNDAPIDVNLKRRHWTDNEKTSADRCKALYMKQLSNARKQSGMLVHGSKKAAEAVARVEVIEAYRQKKKGSGTNTQANLQSLAALVRKDHVSTM